MTRCDPRIDVKTSKIRSRVTPSSDKIRAAGARPLSDAIATRRCSVLMYSSLRRLASVLATVASVLSRGESAGCAPPLVWGSRSSSAWTDSTS